MVSDWTASGYTQCRKDRVVQANYITELEAEIAALWRFVRADDAMQAHDRECDGEDADACQVFGAELVYAREALRPYERGDR